MMIFTDKLNKVIASTLAIVMIALCLPVSAFADVLSLESLTCSKCGQLWFHKSTCPTQVQETQYEPLRAGYQTWSGTQPGGDVTTDILLVGDTVLTNKIVIAAGTSVTLDLNGYMLQGSGSGCIIDNDGTLTIRDSRPNYGVHKFIPSDTGPWVYDDVNGTFEIRGGIITGGRDTTSYSAGSGGGGAIKQGTNALFNVTNILSGTIVGNSTTRAGGAIYGGTINMYGGTVIGNYAGKFGGAFSLSGHFTFAGGMILQNETSSASDFNQANNSPYYENASVIIGGSSNFDMSGGTLIGNISTVNYKSGSVSFNMSGGEVLGKFRILNGATFTLSGGELNGSIYQTNGDCIVSGTMQIYGGHSEYGGTVYVSGGNFTMNGGNISASSGVYGGAVYVSGGNYVMNDGTISGCEATYGGAVYVNGGNFEMHGGMFTQNIADEGGAVYVTGGNILMDGGTFNKNSANKMGGAMYINAENNDAVINILGGAITNNDAGNHGGAISADVSGNYSVTLNVGLDACRGEVHSAHVNGACPTIENNTAGTLGGAFCLHSATEQINVNIYCGSIINNKATKNPGSNTLNQGGGHVVIWGGAISPGIMVGGGIYDDNRVDETQVFIRLHANYDGGPTEPVIVEVTHGITMTFPVDTYIRLGYELSGWSTAPDASGLYIPSNGQYAIDNNVDGYLDFYVVWNAVTTYTITVPDSMVLHDTDIGSMNIDANLSYFKANSILNVTVHNDGVLETPEGATLTYHMESNNSGVFRPVSDGDVVATFQYNNQDTKTLNLALDEGQTILYAGLYTDALTFVIEYFEEEDPGDILFPAYALVLDNTASATDKYPLVFTRSLVELKAGDVYSVPGYGQLKILGAYTGFEDVEYAYNNGSATTAPWKAYVSNITSVRVLRTIKPISMTGWFAYLRNCSYFDVGKINTSQVTSLRCTFYAAGLNVNTHIDLIGLDKWDTSNVTSMVGTFGALFHKTAEFRLTDIRNWNTSKVTSMEALFASAGYNSSNIYIDVTGWDLSSCKSLASAFSYLGRDMAKTSAEGKTLTIVGLEDWDVSNVTNFAGTFNQMGHCIQGVYYGINYTFDLSSWAPTTVTNKSNVYISNPYNTIILPNKLK